MSTAKPKPEGERPEAPQPAPVSIEERKARIRQAVDAHFRAARAARRRRRESGR